MRSLNRAMLIGNVGADPEIHTTATGKKVARISLATSRRTKQNGRQEERTEWHRLVLWERLAQLAEDYLRKGDRLYVEGRIEYGSYERSDVTVPIPTTDIVVDELILLGSPSFTQPPAPEQRGPREQRRRSGGRR